MDTLNSPLVTQFFQEKTIEGATELIKVPKNSQKFPIIPNNSQKFPKFPKVPKNSQSSQKFEKIPRIPKENGPGIPSGFPLGISDAFFCKLWAPICHFVVFYLPNIEYEGSIGFVTGKMKKNYC
jgi:hypothetical protein